MKEFIDNDLENALTEAVHTVGREKVMADLLRMKKESSENKLVLTIVMNAGVHHLAPEYLRGDVFIASEGSLDLSSQTKIHEEFKKILMRAAIKLKSKGWNQVYVVPFGPTPLCMQIKLLVYRICGIESIDVMNIPGQPRVDLAFNLRQLVVESDKITD